MKLRISLNIPAIVRFVRATVKSELNGKCEDFVIVPGCGLKATVTRVDNNYKSLMDDESQHNLLNARYDRQLI